MVSGWSSAKIAGAIEIPAEWRESSRRVTAEESIDSGRCGADVGGFRTAFDPANSREVAGFQRRFDGLATGPESALQRGVSPRLRGLLPRATLRTSPCPRPGDLPGPPPRSTAEARPRVRRWEAKARRFARTPSASWVRVRNLGPE